MRRLTATRDRAGISAGLISVVPLAAMLAFPLIACAQEQPGPDEPSLTDRERDLLERIQNLEKELTSLRDVQARLDAIEAKLGGSSAKRNAEAPTERPSIEPQPVGAVGSPSAAQSYRQPIISGASNPMSGFEFARTGCPRWMSYCRVMAEEFFRPYFTLGQFGGGELLRHLYDKWTTDNSPSILRTASHVERLGADVAAGQAPAETASYTSPTASSSPQPGPPGASGQQPPNQTAGQPPAGTATAANDTFLREAANGNPAMFGEFNPGQGFLVGKTPQGELDLSGYLATRYLDQMPPHQSASDHLGRPIPVNPRRDFQFHRVMLFFQGWLFSPRFRYQAFVWTVQDTNQVAVGGALTYNFSKYFTLGAGWNAYPGTQSLQGSHPYWPSYDRVMADEFFRPYFSQGVFAQGIILPRLEYRWLVGNNNSNLDVPAVKLDRNLSAGAAITWLPTTGEFGPRGAFGDYEEHEKLATRFNIAYTFSPEDRQTPVGTPLSANTTIRLADSLNIFDTGALAEGVTVRSVHYNLISAAAGIKYKGFWLQGEGYGRKVDHIIADGLLPVSVVNNTGFYGQAAYMIVPKRGELYASTSYVFGDFGQHPHEFIVGGNYYPWNTRNLRLNVQLINVSHSPVSSTFGFYVGQVTGPIFTIGFTAFY